MKINFTLLSILVFSSITQHLTAQEYTFENFVGTWHGYISSESFGGYNDPMTMIIYDDHFYTETSGHLMPTIYPNTQECDYEASTNRMHWWYLKTVYAGQYFYQHFFYEIVYFSNDTLEMHYNFWDDPAPHPEVGTIFLVKENLTPPPVDISAEITDEGIVMNWSAPDFPPEAELLGYNIYHKLANNPFEVVGFVEESFFVHEDNLQPGVHTYYVTGVYDIGESDPSEEVEVELLITAIEDNVTGETVIYPNPAENFIHIQTDYKVHQIRLQNISGQTVRTQNGISAYQRMDVNDLPQGLYLLILFTSDGIVSEKVIIQ